MPRRQALTVLFFLLVTAPAAGAPSDDLVGRWYTEGVEHAVYAQMIEERGTDGSFTLEIRVVTACEAQRGWKESGTWDVAQGALRKWTRNVGGRAVPDNEYYHDRFWVTAADADHMNLLDAKTRISWSLTRVSREFTFPSPSPCVNS